MNLWRISRARRAVDCAVLALLLVGGGAPRPAAAAPATRLEDAVVSVFVSSMLSNGRGTGFCVGDGSWVVTCYHVVTVHVGDEKDLPVEHVLVLSPWSGEVVKAEVVATDPKADLALLKLDQKQWPALPVADAGAFQPDKLASEKELFTIAGYGQTSSEIESDPEIHTMSTHAELLAAAQKAERQVLLFAPTPGAGPGWSGGPVVNSHGLVVGVFRALVAQPQVRDVWYPLATGADPLRGAADGARDPARAYGRAPAAAQHRGGRLVPAGIPGHGLGDGAAVGPRRGRAARRAALEPEDPLAHMGLALAEMWQNHLDEALQEADKAITLGPKRASALFEKGLILQRMSRLPDAEKCMRDAIALEPGEAERQITLGSLLAAEGKTTEATTMLRRAAELAPNHPLAHWRLGIALEAENKWDEAVAALQRATQLAEPLPPLRVIGVDLAEALEKAGKPDEAERQWRALARTDDDPALQYRLASFLAGRQKSPEALQALQKCLTLLEQHADPDLLKRATELKSKLQASG